MTNLRSPGLTRRATLAALAAAGAGAGLTRPAGAASDDDIAGLEAALPELYARAQAAGENELTVYTNAGLAAGPVAAKAFEKHFPGIKVKFDGFEPLAGTARIISELSRGPSADLVECSFMQGRPLNQRNSFDKTIDWTKFGVPEDRIGYPGSVQCMHYLLLHAFNPKRAERADLPKRLADFLDPRWRGRLATNDFQLCAHLAYQAMQTDDIAGAIAWVKALRETQALTITGTIDSSQALVAQGEKMLHVWGVYSSLSYARAHGADLDVFATEYAGAACSLLGVLTKARHPLAAQLFALWMLGAEGQDILWSTSFTSWGKGTQRLGKFVRDSRMEVIWESPENYGRRAEINGQLRKALGFS